MSNQVTTRKQLAGLTRAVASSIDLTSLTDALVDMGMTYDMDETNASDYYANTYTFTVSGIDRGDEWEEDGMTLTLALTRVEQFGADIDVTAQKPANEPKEADSE